MVCTVSKQWPKTVADCSEQLVYLSCTLNLMGPFTVVQGYLAESGTFTRKRNLVCTFFRYVFQTIMDHPCSLSFQIFISSMLSALLYVVNFLFLRGTLVIKGGLRITLNPTERWNGSGNNYRRFVAKVAKSMLWYV